MDYPTDAEKQHFGAYWQNIAGVEVRVTRVMFKDNSVWIPAKEQFCKAVFMNEDYDAALKKWQDRGGLLADVLPVPAPRAEWAKLRRSIYRPRLLREVTNVAACPALLSRSPISS